MRGPPPPLQTHSEDQRNGAACAGDGTGLRAEQRLAAAPRSCQGCPVDRMQLGGEVARHLLLAAATWAASWSTRAAPPREAKRHRFELMLIERSGGCRDVVERLGQRQPARQPAKLRVGACDDFLWPHRHRTAKPVWRRHQCRTRTGNARVVCGAAVGRPIARRLTSLRELGSRGAQSASPLLRLDWRKRPYRMTRARREESNRAA